MDKNYEKLVEYIISDDTEKAKELFHNIVVATSREIWESMEHMDHEELADGIAADEEMAPVEEASEDEVTDMMQDMDDTSDMDNMDDMGDMGDMTDMGDAEGEESEDLEDRVMDLEDALDELKAEFDALMADEESEPEHNDGSMDPNFGAEEEGEEEEEEMEMEGTFVREYVEKVADTGQSSPSGKMAGTGAKSENQGEKNTKSPVAGKNDMGGNAVMSKGGNQNQDGTSAPSSDKAQGLPHSGKFLNVPGAKAGATYNTSKKPVSSEPSGVNKKSIES